jgi:hypothetical protein
MRSKPGKPCKPDTSADFKRVKMVPLDDEYDDVPEGYPLLPDGAVYPAVGGRIELDPRSNGQKVRVPWTLPDGTKVCRFYPVMRRPGGRMPFTVGANSNLAIDARALGIRKITWGMFDGVEAEVVIATVDTMRNPNGRGRVPRDPSTYWSKVGRIFPTSRVSSPVPASPQPASPVVAPLV